MGGENMSDQPQPTTDNSEPQFIKLEPLFSSSPSQPSKNLNVNELGYFLDGWADLIEGMGSKVEEVRSKIIRGLQEREMPDIQVSEKNGYVSQISDEVRAYTITTTSPGATTTIYIGKHGKDLYTSWRTFISPVLNWRNIAIAVGIAVFIGLAASELRSLWTFLSTTIILILFEFGVMAIAGRIIKGNFLAYFFIEPTVFDAEDITAMSLSAHKSLFRALDDTGIDVSKLRLKQNFRGGRRGEDI
jgi:hypothetical protein